MDGADVDEQEKGGTAALMVAVSPGHAAIVEGDEMEALLRVAGVKGDDKSEL